MEVLVTVLSPALMDVRVEALPIGAPSVWLGYTPTRRTERQSGVPQRGHPLGRVTAPLPAPQVGCTTGGWNKLGRHPLTVDNKALGTGRGVIICAGSGPESDLVAQD